MTKYISTGISGLDAVLQGGFLRHNSILLKGAPGAGKTSLGIQTLIKGIHNGESGIICSFEQFPQQLQRDALSFGWDLEALSNDGKLTVLYLKPDDLFIHAGQDVPEIISRIHELADDTGARRILIDSVTHFNRAEPDPVRCRSLLLLFLNELKAAGLTPILTAELQSAVSREYAFEEYLVDEVVFLHNEPVTSSSMPQRTVEVVKSRGHGHYRGRHPFRFSDAGLEVFPRIFPEPFAQDEATGGALETVSSGVSGVDALIGGGYSRGGSAILAGLSGAFKTTLAAAFLADGAKSGEKGLYLTFQETPQRLLSMMTQRGIDLAGAVQSGTVSVRHFIPKQTSLEEVFARLYTQVQDEQIKRVVIDSLNDFERYVDNDEMVKDYLTMFLTALARAGATVVFTQQLQALSGGNPISDIRHASLVDTVVYLGSVEIDSRIHKVISALKTRGGAADADLREIECDARGLHVTHKFNGLSGILQGSAQGQRKETVENVFQPLYFIRDFARMGAGDGVTDAQRRGVLDNILNQLGSLESALQEYFGFNPEDEKKK